MIKKPELLLPAGNREKLETALRYGADAVYMAGEMFGLRAKKTAFSHDELADSVAYVHQLGKKVYVTMNIIAHEDDLQGIEEYILYLKKIGVDAVIVSDPGILSIVHETAPDMEIHISTQASTCNSASCRLWYKLGARRVVLARELSLNEIKQIRAAIPEDMELEAFIHGAMCMSYSGRCLLSNVFTGRDANRGECAQPCRWTWKLVADSKEADEMYLEEDERGSYFFNSKDLCMIEHIPELVEAGINSFKIEGRMKGAYYAALTAKTYREAIDAYLADPAGYVFKPEWKEALEMMVHRHYDTGFYFDRPGEDPKIDQGQSYYKEAAVCGQVISASDKYILCEQRNKLRIGDFVEFVRPVGRNLELKISRILDEDLQEMESTPHPKQRFCLLRSDFEGSDQNEEIPFGSFVRREGNKDIRPDG